MTKTFDLGCKTWLELAMLLFAEICNKCSVRKHHDYRLCEQCPKALTINRLGTRDKRATGET